MIVRSTRVVLEDGERPASIRIQGASIVDVGAHDMAPDAGDELLDAGDLFVSPGIVDTHVHVNEPGRTDWEGFDTATRAAAAGGVTTIIDMPLNSVPATTSAAALDAKRAAARDRCHVDVAFWGGVVPGNADELDALVDAGVRGFKCFLAPSGVDEFHHVNERDLRDAMPVLARRGVPLLVHAEDPRHLAEPAAKDVEAYATYARTRPPAAEVSAIELVARLAREYGTRVHVVHVASAEAVGAIALARRAGIAITAETCPHFLTFSADEIGNGRTEFKCAPPIRESRHRDALWDALHDGVLDLVASDHSPAPPAMKCPGDFTRAWGGIASLELSLPAVWTAGTARRRSLSARFVAATMSASPARLGGLDRKGRIARGCDADLVIWDPDTEFVVDAAQLQQRHKLTPYAGRRLRGLVRTTFLRGRRIWDSGALTRAHSGQLL
jgi:allantoinase